MKIIVGLGNIGKEYENTNHNAGFMVIDKVAQHFGVSFNKKDCDAMVCGFFVGGEKFLLAKPTTYINNSGIAVQKLVHKYKVDPKEQLMIISDDFDTKEGTIRIRKVSGNSTHNGIRSIKSYLNSNEFLRVKVSIAPKPLEMSVVDFVLAKIKNDNTYSAIDKASKAVIDFIDGQSFEQISQKYSN